jgi:hypothetical protein
MMHYYAARHAYGLDFAYPTGWTAYVFDDRKDRDAWVDDCNSHDNRSGYNPRSETISRKIAQRISGSRTCEGHPITRGDCGYTTEVDVIVGHMLETYEGYYNPNYWS